MTKNIATVHDVSISQLVEKLGGIGYSLANPDSNFAHLFRPDGDMLSVPPSEALDTLKDDEGILLWQDATHSAYICVSYGKPRIFFDGFTREEEASFCEALSKLGIAYTVAHEDVPFEA